jgi:hypothetical protein
MGRNLGRFPLAPSDGERAGVRGTLAVVAGYARRWAERALTSWGGWPRLPLLPTHPC